jgi:hypothetical protein
MIPDTLIQPRAISSTQSAYVSNDSPDEVRRVLVLVLQLGGDRDDLGLDERPDRLQDLLLDVGQPLGLLQPAHLRLSSLVSRDLYSRVSRVTASR